MHIHRDTATHSADTCTYTETHRHMHIHRDTQTHAHTQRHIETATRSRFGRRAVHDTDTCRDT